MREMTDGDLARVRAAVQLRERCVRAALAHHEWVDLTPRHDYARATFDAMEQIIRADERAKVARAIDALPEARHCGCGWGSVVRVDAVAAARQHTTGSTDAN